MRSLIFKGLFFTLLTGIGQLSAQNLDWAYSIQHTSVQNYSTAIASNGRKFVLAGVVAPNINLDVMGKNPQFDATKCFVAKYKENSEIEWWVEQPGGGNNSRVFNLLMDASENVYVTGYFSGTLDFDPGAGTQNYTASAADAFVQKLDPEGKLIWVAYASAGGPPSQIVQKSNGNLVIAGMNQDKLVTKISNGDTISMFKGVYLYEISTDGKVIGAYNFQIPTGYTSFVSLAVDKDDNILVGGSVSEAIDLDPGTGLNWDTAISSYDAFLIKLSDKFQYQWHKIFGDIPNGQPGGWDAVRAIGADGSGNIYAAGYFTWNSDFDPKNDPGKFVLEAGASKGSQTPDGFIIKYDASGNILWIRDAGTHPQLKGNTDVNFYDLLVHQDKVIVSGTLNGSGDFDGSADTFMVRTLDGGLGLCYTMYDMDGNFKNAWLIDGFYANEVHTGIELLGDGILASGTFQKRCDMDPGTGYYLLKTDSTGNFYNADNDIFLARYALFPAIFSVGDLNQDRVGVYPNPTFDGSIFLSGISSFNGMVEVYSSEGLKVMETPLNPVLDLSELPSGLYHLNIRGEKFNFVTVIKQ
ncbi:MAG: T9SS type A sorting domain-containing protein [Flavobacteriales bacterium]|nr:T9SS type A sorting domain-containing protein [Flavobacteriales bacterium]